MKVLVAGAGILGLQIARTIEAKGNSVTVVEVSSDRADRVRADLSATVIEGDTTDVSVLERAKADEHDAFLALTGVDEDNLVASLMAKRQFDVKRVVARVNDPRNTWLFDKQWGIDVAMSAPAILVSLLEEATASSQTVNLFELATAGVRMVETSIGPSSTLVGRALKDIEVPAGVVIATVVRGGQAMVPDGETCLKSGDQVLVVVDRSADASIEAIFAGTS